MASLIRYYFFTIDTVSYWLMGALLVGGYLIFIPPSFLFAMTMISLPISLYYYEHKSNTDRFLISLPISPSTIIQSRYAFTILMALIVLLFQVVIMNASSIVLSSPHYMYSWQDVISLLLIAWIALAIIIPIYHLSQSFLVATSVICLLVFAGLYFLLLAIVNVMNVTDFIIFNDLDPGLVLLLEKYIPYEPYTVLTLATLLFLYFSMKISVYLFTVKDS